MDKLDRVKKLVEILNNANIEYYVHDNPSITDYEYDMMLKELISLEQENPILIQKNSPTQRVGGEVLTKFEKVKHNKAMLSLANAFNESDLINFDSKIKEVHSNATYVCELKIDGLSVAITYNDSHLEVAATRGNGEIGENITNNVKTINSIPLNISNNSNVEVRGEIFMPKSSFIKLNEERLVNSEELFANCRNAAAGSVRQLDSSIASKRNLDVFLYDLIVDDTVDTQYELLNKIKDLGFKVNPEFRHCKSIFEVIDYIK
ncbi:MAG: NAD-dependent DNA ligase LigA, partial [Anaeroplasmataceae bacterium]